MSKKLKNIIFLLPFIIVSFLYSDNNIDIDNIDVPNCTNCYEPIANAGQNATYYKGGTVTLNALDSYDPDGSELTYLWIAPEEVLLTSSTSSNPQFIAPDVFEDTEYIIELIVNDGDYDSESDFVAITVAFENTAPVIETIDILSVNKNESFLIDASTSYDATLTGILDFQWLAPDFIVSSGSNSSTVNLIAPDVSSDQNYNIALTVLCF